MTEERDSDHAGPFFPSMDRNWRVLRRFVLAGISFYRENTDNHPIRTIVKWCVDILVVAAAAVILVSQIFNTVRVNGRSMEPTLAAGDKVLMSRIKPALTVPDRYDIIVFEPGGDETRRMIRRIVGLPGETVLISEGVISIDGTPLTDAFSGAITIAGVAENEISLGEDEYFVLGDNVNSSEDSRFAHIGNIKEEEIEGVVWFRYAPIDRLSPVR